MDHISKENALPRAYQDEIERLLYSMDFPWFANHEHFLNTNTYSLGFTHLALNDGPDLPKGTTASTYFNQLLPIWYTMGDILGKELGKLLRLRCGLLVPSMSSNTIISNVDTVAGGDEAHIDFLCPHWTGLYYVNDSDGDTVVYNETKPSDNYTVLTTSTPKKGKMFIFNGKHYHSSSKPTEGYYRCVLTFNFTTE